LGGVDWKLGRGSPEKKLSAGGPRGMAGAATERQWGVVSGRAGRCSSASRRFGQWWLVAQGVEFHDKLEALDFVSNGWKI